MSRAAGYADFFPAAPSVLAEKERAARQHRTRDHGVYDKLRGVSSALHAPTTQSTNTGASALTPNTSTSSPPPLPSPSSTNRHDSLVRSTGDNKKEKSHSAIMTPKATPPAKPESNPDPPPTNLKCIYDPELAPKGTPKRSKRPLYRTNGEGVGLVFLSPSHTRQRGHSLKRVSSR